MAVTYQESENVQIRELRNSKLPILLDMYQFVEQESVGKWHMRYDDIGESNRSHLAKIWQICESHSSQKLIACWVCDPDSVEVRNSDVIE